MDLLDLRADFTRISGRSELTDAQVDRYINRGQNYLDLLTEFKHARARDFQVVAANAMSVTFTSKCRVIQEVWVMDNVGRWELKKYDMNTFRREFSILPSALDPGLPTHYTPALLRTNPDPLTIADFTQYLGFMDVNVTGTSHAYNGVVFRPPTDKQYVIETFGKFYTPDLTEADPDSWWTFTAYTAILHATLRELELDYRNTEGANDWEQSILKTTRMLSMDDAEEDAIGINAFEAE